MTDHGTVVDPQCPRCRSFDVTSVARVGESFVRHGCDSCGKRWVEHDPPTVDKSDLTR